MKRFIIFLLICSCSIDDFVDIKYPAEYFKYEINSNEEKILHLINSHRPTIKLTPEKFLDIQANIRVEEFINNHIETGELDHTGYADNHLIVMECGANYVGENLSFGYATTQGVVNGWLSSVRHKVNMLNEQFTMIGISIKEYNSRKYYCAFFAGDK